MQGLPVLPTSSPPSLIIVEYAPAQSPPVKPGKKHINTPSNYGHKNRVIIW
jgi:hypothetical protein